MKSNQYTCVGKVGLIIIPHTVYDKERELPRSRDALIDDGEV